MLSIRSPITRSAPVVELLDEARDLVEVVGEVGVGHHDVVAARGGEAGQVGAAVAAARLVHDARAGGGGELGAAVLGGVVGDDDLAGDAVLAASTASASDDAVLDVLLLVEAGDHDRHAGRARASAVVGRVRGCMRKFDRAHGNGREDGVRSSVVNVRERRKARSRRDRVANDPEPVCHPPAPCGSASSTTACSRRRSAAPSAGTATSRSARRRGPRRHLPDAAPVGRGDRAEIAGRPGRRRRPADGAVRRGRPAAHPAAAGVRRRRARGTCCATAAATTSCTPRRSRTSRCWPPALLRRLRRYRLVVDWFEVWTREYWREYLGGARRPGRRAGPAPAALRRAASGRSASRGCTRRRLRRGGLRGERDGARAGCTPARSSRTAPQPAEPVVVFAGRHIPEKRAPARGAGGGAAARATVPELRGVIFGDGPERGARAGRDRARAAPADVVERAGLRRRRRGRATALRARAVHGAAVAPRGLRAGGGRGRRRTARRASWCAGPDNAAVELIEEGVNGFVAASASPEDLADAIVRGARGRRRRCASRPRAWFARNAPRLSLRRLARTRVVARATAASGRARRSRPTVSLGGAAPR